jgi:hypothetical protein
MSDPYYKDQAEVAARLEAHFDDIAYDYSPGGSGSLSDYKGLEGYTVLDVQYFDNTGNNGPNSPKAITVQDSKGNIYIHFRGTGDGYWGQNTAAYGDHASDVQKWAHEYCDKVIQERCILNTNYSGEKVYITGHSQGGNNAQYAMLTTEYPDYVESCISLDGQGFSHGVSNDLRDLYGEDGFTARQDKIYAYDGANDFVSPLGQEQLVRDDHTYIVQLQETGYATEGESRGVAGYHDVRWMIDEDGHFGDVRLYTDPDNGESAFRKTIRDLNDLINHLPPDMQERIAERAMMVAEFFMGSNYRGDPSLIGANLLLLEVVPALILTFILHPDDFIGLLKESGILDAITNFAKEHPFMTIALVLCLPFLVEILLPLGIALAKILVLLDVIGMVVEAGIRAFKVLCDFCAKAFEIIKKAVKAIKDWARNTFNRGVGYVKNHPSFSADPVKLRSYASRVASVNRRLRNLDGMLDSLYWQVGFFDLGTIMDANLLTSGSPTLTQIQHYLEHTAERLETAEAKAKAYMGG